MQSHFGAFVLRPAKWPYDMRPGTHIIQDSNRLMLLNLVRCLIEHGLGEMRFISCLLTQLWSANLEDRSYSFHT